jgi:hypothetical protein
MSRITLLFAALCIAAAPIVAATNSSAQKGAEKTDKDQADKATVSKPEAEKTEKSEKFDLDGLIRGIKEMVDKGLKEDKPTSTPAAPATPAR